MRSLLLPWHRNYLFLIPLFAACLFYQISYTIVVVWKEARPAHIVNSPFHSDDGTVSSETPEAEKAGLHRGDRVLQVDAQSLRGERDLQVALRRHQPNQMLSVTVLSKGQTAPRKLELPLTPSGPPTNDLQDWIITCTITAVLLLCVFIGVYAAAMLPADPRALVLFALLVSTAQMVRSASWFHFPRGLWEFAEIFALAGSITWSFWLLCFGLIFPEPFAWDLRRPWLKWLFLGPIAVLQCLTVVGAFSGFYSYQAFPEVLDFPLLHNVIIPGGSVAFFFTALGMKLGRAKTSDAQRRLRILMIGSMVSLSPVGCLVAYMGLTNKADSQIPQWIMIPICILFCLFPITLGYVIIVERSMNLRMAIRQGVRYALARSGMRVLVGLLFVGAMFALNALIVGSAIRKDAQLAIFIGLILVLVFLVRKTRSQLMVWIDRRFFREAYNAQMILEHLSDTVRSIVDEREMLDTVARRISDSLHVPRFAVLLNGADGFRPVYSLGFEAPAQLNLPADSKTVEIVTQTAEPPQIYFERRDNWVHSTPADELVTLQALHAQLLLPVGSKQRLLGILSLGPKLSEEPYSSSDLQLLRSVATQTGLALENSRLTKAIATEMAHRETLSREIEIAREVQERLFPQRLPAIAGIDFSGACRPALGVGGDYYDFLELANGDLGIAIGDVSGKGIAAALLMASLQASLRGQAMMGQGDLARLMTNVNQLVHEATTSNRYATFFYGQYQRDSRTFRYVNAGHNAPFVLRRSADGPTHVIRLDTGGPVVGLFPKAPYQEGSVALEPGDIFVGFTDGISEAMNGKDEEWGEERLIPAVARNAGCRAADIIPNLMAEADRFVSGAPQHDDMTIIVMKMDG